MHVLLTGATGRVGRHTLSYLVEQGHTVMASDIHPPPASVVLPPSVSFLPAQLTSIPDVDRLFDVATRDRPLDGVIHLGAIPNPRPDLDDRVLHNNNTVGSYNVMRTAVDRGVKRIVQASSVNAHGLSYSPPGHTKFDRFPIDERAERRPEDAYALSKHECEIQADSLVRWAPGTRVASLRFHMVMLDYDDAWPRCTAQDLFSWVSYSACARACVLGLTSEGWEKHEVFNIVAPETCWEGGVEQSTMRKEGEPPGERAETLALVKKYWPHPVEIDEAYFANNPRAAIWVSAKAERMLGWKHDE